MSNITIENSINITQAIPYFLPEILCGLAILANFIIFIFFGKKDKTKKASDITTFTTFFASCITLIFLYLRNKFILFDFSFSLFNNLILFNSENIIYKFIFYLFFTIFVLCTYKLTRKARFKTPIVNSHLLALAPFCCLVFQSQNLTFSFVALDVCVFLIYKFASNMRMRKDDMYCLDFVVMSSMATVLFFLFYLVANSIKVESQLAIINTCVSLALLLKIGIFPVYNYALNRHYKNNLPYSILLFALLPVLGLVVFSKFLETIDLSSEIYLTTMFAFASVTILTSAINAFKTKNFIKYLANASYVYYGIMVYFLLIVKNNLFCIKSGLILTFCLFAIYSMLCVLKLNLKPSKINFSSLSGLSLNNGNYCILLSCLILILINIFPSAILFNNLEILKGIYEYENIGSYLVFIAIVANTLIIYNGILAIKMCYAKTNNTIQNFTKKTVLNYTVSSIISIFLIIQVFL